jgi:hypothetical protein
VICCGLKVSSPNPTRCRSQGVEGTLAAALRVVPVGRWESRLRATGPSAKRRRHLGTGRRPPRPAVNMGSTLPRTTGESTRAASPPITPRSWSARTSPGSGSARSRPTDWRAAHAATGRAPIVELLVPARDADLGAVPSPGRPGRTPEAHPFTPLPPSRPRARVYPLSKGRRAEGPIVVPADGATASASDHPA